MLISIKKRYSAVIMTALALMLSLSACNKAPESATPTDKKPLVRSNSSSLSSDYAAMRAQQVSNVAYNLSVKIDHTSERFSGVANIQFTMAKDNIDDLTLDFDQGKIESLTVNGKAAQFSYEKWFITLAAAQFTVGPNTVTVKYSREYAIDGTGFHRFVDPENKDVYLYTDFEPYSANEMFPHFDQPNVKATFAINVTAPKHWQVISTTRETKIESQGDNKHWSFPASARISSYVFSLHAGKYKVWQDTFKGKQQEIPLRLFARQSLAKYVKIDDWFTPTKQSLGFFNQYFDIAYPFDKYDSIIVPDYNSGAMENVAAVTFNELYVSKGEKSTNDRMKLAKTISHEMAHMWFGDLVTMDWWNGLWLNESFASYMAYLALEKATDFENTWDSFYTGYKQWAYRMDDSVNTHAIELQVLSTGDALNNFDGITYGKGSSVLKQLPFYLGEEAFRVGVNNYLKKYSYKNTTLQDFTTELGKAANKDLSQWTQDWLYKAGLNTIEVDYQCKDQRITSFNIKQTAPQKYPTLRAQRVQIGLYQFSDQLMALSETIAVTYQGANTQVTQALGKACPDLVYPNQDDWGYVKVNLDAQSLQAVKQHINAIDNNTVRLMIWQSLIDSVRDAKLSAKHFTDFALANIAGEKDINVSRRITHGIELTLDYLDQASELGQHDFSAQRMLVENKYLALLTQAKVGSDEQKLWYRVYVETVRSQPGLTLLSHVLSGERAFNGLTIDQSKRWDIIATLNRFEFGQYQQTLAREQLIDKSDSGVKRAIFSQVVRPDAANKAYWFERLVQNQDKLKLATLRYIMTGLFQPEQQKLKTRFKQQILSHINTLNAGDDLLLLRSFSAEMIPETCNPQGEKLLADYLEKSGHMKVQALKSIKAAHEYVQRCVNIVKLL
jgi:aminopeptidase N